MLIEKVITTQIETKDPTLIYAADQDAAIKKLLTDRFVNKCFKRCFVTEIVEVTNNSPFIFESNRNGGYSRIVVVFKIRGVVYDKFEIVPDAKIIEIMEDGKLILLSKYATIGLAASPKLQNFRKGQMVPVRVVDARYVPQKSLISAQGIPFVPIVDPNLTTFDLGVITKDELKAHLPMLIERIEEEQKKFAEREAKIQKKWNDLLTNGKPDKKLLKGYESSEIEILESKTNITVFRPAWMPVGDTTVYWKPSAEVQEYRNSVQVLKGFLNAVLKDLQAANQLADLYDIGEKHEWMTLYTKEKA